MDILTTQQDGLYETLTPIQFHNLYLKLLALFENGNLTIDDEHYLSGAIKVDRAYQYAVDFFNYHYQEYGLSILHVHESDPYYEFEDPNTQLGVANTWGGQNPGMTVKNMENTVTWPAGNTLKSLKGWKDAVKFNEFSMFTRMTTPNKNDVFREMPNLEEIDCTNLTKLTDRFFYQSSKLYKVGANINNELPNLLNLGYEVFNRTPIENISIPNLIDTTLQRNFYECKSLKTAHIDGQNLNTIDSACFYNDEELTSVTGLTHLMKINGEAFRHCLKLNNVDNINNVTFFGSSCFTDCALMDIDLTSAEYIYDWAFTRSGITNANLQNIKYLTNGLRECHSLKTVTFGDNYTDYTITGAAFYDDGLLETINLDNCIEIQGEAFGECKSLRTIGDTSNLLRFSGTHQFRNCYLLESINLSNIKLIPRSCFEECRNLSELGDISNVERIDAWAFHNSGITGTIELTNVEILGNAAFYGCSKLTELNIGPYITYINDSGPNENYKGCTALTTFIGPKLKTIYRSDFSECTSLTTVEVPECTLVDDYAFYGCTSLTDINLPKVVTMKNNACRNTKVVNFSAPLLTALDSEAFRDVTTLKNVSIESIEIIGTSAFYNCNHLETISQMHNVKTIDSYAFIYCSLLEGTIDIPNIEFLGNEAFRGCNNIEHVILSNKLKQINNAVFTTCENLKDITNSESWESIGKWAFRDCKRITSLNLSNVKNLTCTNGNDGFHFSGMILLETVTSLENLESIEGEYAFYNCIALKTAPLSNKIKVIPSYTFESCRSLENIGDLTGLTTVNIKSFYNTVNLNYSGNLPNLEYIGPMAFSGSGIGPNLNLPKWSKYNTTSNTQSYFSDCLNIVTVNIPALNIIPTSAFYGCTNLESVTFSENLTEIGYYAFQNCSKLNNVVIPATVTIFRNQCFQNCTSLKIMTVKATTPPECPNGNPFAGTTFNAIYVPAGSVDAYKAAAYWKTFANVIQAI